MKKSILTLSLVVVVLIGSAIVLATIDFNRVGKEEAYYQVGEPSSVEETKLDNGEIMKRYIYSGEAYNEAGDQLEVEFTAGKKLKEDAYLKLYVNKENEVTSFDEVSSDVAQEVITPAES